MAVGYQGQKWNVTMHYEWHLPLCINSGCESMQDGILHCDVSQARSTGAWVLALLWRPLIWSPQASGSMGGGCQLFAILVGPGLKSPDSHGWNGQSPPLIGPRGMLSPQCGSSVGCGGKAGLGDPGLS